MFDESNEIEFIVWVQERLGDGLEPLMQFFTLLGFPIIYIFMIPIVFWCVDSRLGLRLALFIFAGGLINDVAKLALRSPRPFWVSSEVRVFRDTSGGFGMPSGHAQVAAVAWGWLIAAANRGWTKIAAVAVALMIGFSRIYLGVHFPSQVAVGLVVGTFIVVGMYRFDTSFSRRYGSLSVAAQLAAVVGGTAVVTGVGYLMARSADGWVVPERWATNFAAATNGEDVLDAGGDHGLALSAGSFLGTSSGAILQRRLVPFDSSGAVAHRLLRIPVGILALAVPAAIVSSIFAALGADTDNGASGELFGFALTFGAFLGVFLFAPALFRRLHINPRPGTTTDSGR